MASLERHSKHPLASPILNEAERKQLVMLDADEVSEKAGQGLTAQMAGAEFAVIGKKQFRGEEKLPELPRGHLECLLLRDSKLAAVFQFFDAPRQDTHLFFTI